MTSVDYYLYNDSGFTEGSVVVPSKDDDLSVLTPDIESKGHHPRSEDMFSIIKLRKMYHECMNLSYVKAVYKWNDSDTSESTFYGWVDSVEILSEGLQQKTSEGKTSMVGQEVIIHWHIDYWRTYLGSASYGSGIVQRKSYNDDMTCPMQSVPFRYRQVKRYMRIINQTGVWDESVSANTSLLSIQWVIVAYVHQSNDGKMTQLEYYCFPVETWEPLFSCYYKLYKSTTEHSLIEHRSMSVTDIIEGRFDEYLGLVPSAVVGVWITPLCPADIIGTYVITSGSQSAFSVDAVAITHTYNNINYAYFKLDGDLTAKPTYSGIALQSSKTLRWVDRSGNYSMPSSTDAFITTETSQYSVCNERGEIIATLPAQLKTDYIIAYNSIGSDGCYLILRFVDSSKDNWTHLENLTPMEGLEVRVALQMMPVTGNSWSEYAYTYARQYDIDSRLNAIEIAHLKGFTSGIEGGMTGALAGAAAGSAPGAIAGTLIGAAGSLISNEAVYNIDKGNADKLQRMEDMNHAMQSENMLMVGSAPDWMGYGKYIRIIELEIDEYSANLFSEQKLLNGVKVSEPSKNCSTLISGTGPLQISQLVITGGIPVEAKRYIKAKLEQGVRLTTVNVKKTTEETEEES